MALGTASTGTAISSLSGAAATNATLAAIGGGAISAGGGGIALGSALLGTATLGVGLLVGGVIFGITGSKLSDKADEAFSQMMKNKDKINKICKYLQELEDTASIHFKSLSKAKEKYEECFYRISYIVNNLRIVDYNKFSYEDKKTLENLSLLVKLLYDMCKINLVNKSNNDTEINTVNKNAILRCKQDTEQMLSGINLNKNQSLMKDSVNNKNEVMNNQPDYSLAKGQKEKIR